MMSKKQYKKTFGEDPVDMFGSDWRNILDDLYYEQKAENDEVLEEINKGKD